MYPMLTKANVGKSLVNFTDEVGTPQVLMTDLASKFSGQHADFVKHCHQMRIQLCHKEKGRYKQNHAAEREIGFLSERWRRRMAKKSVPRRLWDFGLVYEAELLSRLSRGRDGRKYLAKPQTLQNMLILSYMILNGGTAVIKQLYCGF